MMFFVRFFMRMQRIPRASADCREHLMTCPIHLGFDNRQSTTTPGLTRLIEGFNDDADSYRG